MSIMKLKAIQTSSSSHFPYASHIWIFSQTTAIHQIISVKFGLQDSVSEAQRKSMCYSNISLDKCILSYIFYWNIIFPEDLYIWKIKNVFMLLFSTWTFIIVSDRAAGVNSWKQWIWELKGTRCSPHLGFDSYFNNVLNINGSCINFSSLPNAGHQIIRFSVKLLSFYLLS